MTDSEELARLKKSEMVYRRMIEMAADAIFAIDTESGEILGSNPKASELTGLSDKEITGRKVWELHPEDEQDAARELFFKVVKTGSGSSEMRFVRPDGSERFVEVNATTIDCGERLLIQRICRDITERRKLREQLKQANEELEQRVTERTAQLQNKQAQLIQAEKMAALGSLVAGVAHEINTPLGALRSNLDLFERSMKKIHDILDKDTVPTELREDPQLEKLFSGIDKLNEINDEATVRIIKIVDSLRRFARLDQAEKDTVDIHEGIENTLTLVHHKIKGRIEVERDFAELPAIECYPNQLNQVFMNILVNASQAIEDKGTITIKTSLKQERVVIEISDTGSGIPEDIRSRIFDPGFTTKGAGVGTGLGLAIVHQIIEDHSGSVEVDARTRLSWSMMRRW